MGVLESSKKFGSERIEFAKAAKTEADWKKWAVAKNPFPFKFQSCWNQTIEFKVEDFEAEVGFFIDMLGFDCNTLSENYAMMMGYEKEFYFSVRRVKDGETPTPVDAITLEYMIQDLAGTVEKLKERGIEFIKDTQREEEGSPMWIAEFKTPHGILIRLWSFTAEESTLN